MTPLDKYPVPQFPHLSNVSTAVPAHAAAGMGHRCRWEAGKAQGAGRLAHSGAPPSPKSPPLLALLSRRPVEGLATRLGLAGSPSHPPPARHRAGQPKCKRVTRRRQGPTPISPSLGPPCGRALFSPRRDKALLESSWARWHLVQAWLRQTGS